MKMKALGLIGFLFAGNTAAGGVQLICTGYGISCTGTGAYDLKCHQTNESADIRLDQEAGTVEFERKGKWLEGRKVQFGDSEISAEFAGSLRTMGVPYTLTLDRFSGSMEFDSWQGGWSGQCQAVDVSARAF